MLKVVEFKRDKFKIYDTVDKDYATISVQKMVTVIENGIVIDNCFKVEPNVYKIDKWVIQARMVGRKFRIYPNNEQQIWFKKQFGCERLLWNCMLHDKEEYYEEHGESLITVYNDYVSRYPFLKERDSSALSKVARRLNTAYKNFFDSYYGNRKGRFVGKPRYKSKKNHYQTYQTAIQNGKKIIDDKGMLILPKLYKKLGGVRIKVTRPFIDGTVKTITIIHEPSDKWYISFNIPDWVVIRPKTTKEVGIDLGLKDHVIESNGMKHENLHISDKRKRKLRRLARSYSRKNQARLDKINEIKKQIKSLEDSDDIELICELEVELQRLKKGG